MLVNGAEGEPGSFKDRTLLVRNPYRVLEGALIAAHTVGADRIVVALKRSFAEQIARLRPAIDEVRERGWADGIELDIVAGPSEYLFGEETALLEVTEGRPPFPRVDTARTFAASRTTSPPSQPSPRRRWPTTSRRWPTSRCILANGATWFRELGTAASPGTVVCTVSGSTLRAGVGEVPLGTPLRTVIEEIGGGTAAGADVQAVLSGVSHPFLPASALDTPLTYEDMEAAGSGLGATGFIVFDDGRRSRRRGPGRVSLPRRGVVRPVHAVQAGRPRHRRAARTVLQLRRHRP